MSLLVPLTLLGWIPVVLLLFALLPPRRAVTVAFVSAWLFLPMAGYELPGLPPYTKMSATCLGVLIGVAIFDAGRMSAFRFRMLDLPFAIWCVCPFFSSITNGLGTYDGLSAVLGQLFKWGLPYFIGRLYYGDLEGLRELALGIFIGGLAYVPLCLYEIRMSPQLHVMVYGFHQHSFDQTYRLGGWRPVVFMQHGLMVGMWMTSASLVGLMLWRSRAVLHLNRLPVSTLVGVQLLTTVLCKSFGSLVLLAVGLGLMVFRHTRLAVLAVLLLAPLYMTLRAGGWYPSAILDAVGVVGPSKVASLRARVDNEVVLVERALEQPIFGWGTHNRNRVYDHLGRPVVTDSLWIITFGQRGLVGLASLTAMLMLGPGLLLLNVRPSQWLHPALAPAVALALVVVLFTFDSLVNGMLNPLYTIAAGGLTGMACLRKVIRDESLRLERVTDRVSNAWSREPCHRSGW